MKHARTLAVLAAAGALALAATGCGSSDTGGKKAAGGFTAPDVPMAKSLGTKEGAVSILAWPGYAEDGTNDPKTDWDKRARGLGGKITSCGEENLLNLKGDRYRSENILIHEFSHAIHRYGIGVVDRWTGETCVSDRCWKGGHQTVPVAEPAPLARLGDRAGQ